MNDREHEKLFFLSGFLGFVFGTTLGALFWIISFVNENNKGLPSNFIKINNGQIIQVKK